MCWLLVPIDEQHGRHALNSTSFVALVGSSPLPRSGGTPLIDRTLANLRLQRLRAARMPCLAQLCTADAAAMFGTALATRRIARTGDGNGAHEGRRRDQHERKDLACRSKHGYSGRMQSSFNHLAQTHIRQAWFFSASGEPTRPRSVMSSAAWAMPARWRFVVCRVRLRRRLAARRSQDNHDNEKNTQMNCASEHRFTS